MSITFSRLVEMREEIRMCQEAIQDEKPYHPQIAIQIARKNFIIIEQLLGILIDERYDPGDED